MERITKLISLLVGALSIATLGATLIYLFGFGLGYGREVLPYCAVTDFVRIAIQWLIPMGIGTVFTGIIAVPLGRLWWLIDAVVISIVCVFLFVSHFFGNEGGLSAEPQLIALVIGNLVGIGAALAAGWVIHRRKGDWILLSVMLTLLFVISIAFSRGYSAGHKANHPLKSADVLSLSGEKEFLTGNVVYALDGYLLFREKETTDLVAVPSSVVRYIKMAP